MKINRVWAMPNKWTFKIKPIEDLLFRYNVNSGWVDPFAGMNSPAEFTNDIEGRNAKIIISPLGNQGFLFGRGNLQFSPQVLKKIGSKNIIIISTIYKLANIPNQILRLDTRDPELDKKLKGYYKVIVDYDELRIIEVR